MAEVMVFVQGSCRLGTHSSGDGLRHESLVFKLSRASLCSTTVFFHLFDSDSKLSFRHFYTSFNMSWQCTELVFECSEDFLSFVEVLLEAADWPANHCLTPHRVRSGEFWHAQQGLSMFHPRPRVRGPRYTEVTSCHP